MSNPTVCAIMLTADRPELARRAVECFRAQTYENKALFVLASGEQSAVQVNTLRGEFCATYTGPQESIGTLRNAANRAAFTAWGSDILCHWDDDDWSHPNRIAEQVALLQLSKADVFGYDQMLFYREPEAWFYIGEILGTSLCYWRRTWEQTPFAANHILNEDGGFVSEVRAKGGKVVAEDSVRMANAQPRMIARIHQGNANNPAYRTLETHPNHWQRVPQWDSYCRKEMR